MVRNPTRATGNKGNYMGQFKGSKIWHRIPARSSDEARGKMIKNSKWKGNEVTIKRYKFK